MHHERENHSVTLLCKVLEVSRSGYYKWLSRGISERQEKREKLLERILEIFQDWAKFESFINELDESRSKGLKEFKDFYQKLKEADFKEIEYDFKEIDPEY